MIVNSVGFLSAWDCIEVINQFWRIVILTILSLSIYDSGIFFIYLGIPFLSVMFVVFGIQFLHIFC